MGYFSNGTEGDGYREKYCDNCIHKPVKQGDFECVVWDAHMFYNYDLCNETSAGKKILDVLIPINEETSFCDQCTMFIQIKSQGQTGF